MSESNWWQQAAIYQIYPRSFQDSDADGVGDLRGITSRLPYLVGRAGDSAEGPSASRRAMPMNKKKSDEYREHARACLELAAEASDGEIRRQLKEAAAHWQRLADQWTRFEL